jgi:hypothetical protein
VNQQPEAMLRHVGDFNRVGSCLFFQYPKTLFSRKGAKLAKKF